MGESGGDVLEPEGVFGKPRNLEDDPRCGDAVLFVSASSGLKRRARRFWEARKIGIE
jgi:hypothetical protein